MSEWWQYDNLESGAPYDWSPAGRGEHPDDNIDFHIDLGAGKIPKGRLTIDRHGDVDILCDLDTLTYPSAFEDWNDVNDGRLCFPDNSIESIISHHCLEHIGNGFIRLMDECFRILKPGGKFRIIVPLFPSFAAVNDPDHKRFFTKHTLQSFLHNASSQDPFWSDSFAEPYTKCRFKNLEQICDPAPFVSPPISIDTLLTESRELRATLTK